MRLNILIDSTGALVNGAASNHLINFSPIDGDANSSLFNNQITIECVNAIKTQPNGEKTPDYTTVVTSGLSGTLEFQAFPSQYAPYPVTITPSGIIDLATDSILQFVGIVEALDIVATGITGCNYINLLIDRN